MRNRRGSGDEKDIGGAAKQPGERHLHRRGPELYLFEDWLRPHLGSGALEPVLEPWWQRFSGPFLYYPGRRLLPAPLRAFVDFIKASAG